jgi:hypothetical protein
MASRGATGAWPIDFYEIIPEQKPDAGVRVMLAAQIAAPTRTLHGCRI